MKKHAKKGAIMLKFGLLGEKLEHSQSPKLHQQLMKDKGIDGTYELIEISKDVFEDTFLSLKNSDFRGVNVTIPYKETVIPFLDEISPQAKYIGAVNTILFSNGKAKGFNTDYFGFRALFEHNNIKAKGCNAIVLGAGGVAKAVQKALCDMGIFDLTVVSRGKENFHNQYTVSYDFYKEKRPKTDILVNCTPVGMYPNINASPLPKALMRAKIAVDVIYNPEETLFLKYAKELGMKTINGSLMLYEQAAKAQEIWENETL